MHACLCLRVRVRELLRGCAAWEEAGLIREEEREGVCVLRELVDDVLRSESDPSLFHTRLAHAARMVYRRVP